VISSLLWFVVSRAFEAYKIPPAMLDAVDEIVREGGGLP
jgi:hypothetical protein